MKKLLLFVFAALAFAACTQDVVVDITPAPIVDEVPETLVVGFEGDDTRIQRQNGKTVWTKGDLVSVFYRSNANQQWKYDGETGARTANLKRVDAGTATRDMDRVVVVYPYNEDYYINPSTFNVQASLPATQHYLANSYGLDGNIMISSAEYNDVTLKNVCGWLKLQLTGDGEVVKSITFKGNNGEQVAGELYINSAEATAILASDMGNIAEDDGNNATGGAGANLSFDDVVLKKVTLDCGEGVTLGKSATAFYIALPPQTFTKGFKVEIVCADDTKMVKSSNKALSIERNHIQPMAEMEFTPSVPNNQIWYTATKKAEPWNNNAFGTTIISNEWDSETGKGIITFDGNIAMIGDYAFQYCTSLTSVNIPDSVTTIGGYAFRDCGSLTSVNIPESVTTIGEDAFYRCESLTSVNIPDSVTTIGDWAFSECTNLTSITIGNSVTTIGEGAFALCSRLREFTGKYAADGGRCLIIDNTIITYAEASGTTYNIPESVTTIGGYAFTWCTSLTSVNIPDSVTTIRECAFCACSSLTSVNIPESVTTIGDYAFWNCDSFTSVNIPDSVTTIGDYAFTDCNSLTSVTIPDSVTTIGSKAFYSCYSLTSVYCKATTPPALGGSDVFGYNASGRRIIVPIGSGEVYRKATYWSEYADDIIEDEF